MTDDSIFARIDDLVNTERELRVKLAAGEISREDEQTGSARSRPTWTVAGTCCGSRAKREFGGDPDDAEARPAGTVEGYLG